jgi:hypothetical protein
VGPVRHRPPGPWPHLFQQASRVFGQLSESNVFTAQVNTFQDLLVRRVHVFPGRTATPRACHPLPPLRSGQEAERVPTARRSGGSRGDRGHLPGVTRPRRSSDGFACIGISCGIPVRRPLASWPTNCPLRTRGRGPTAWRSSTTTPCWTGRPRRVGRAAPGPAELWGSVRYLSGRVEVLEQRLSARVPCTDENKDEPRDDVDADVVEGSNAGEDVLVG